METNNRSGDSQGDDSATPIRVGERERVPREFFEARSATVDNRERREAIGEGLPRQPQIEDEAVNPMAFEQAERLRRSRKPIDLKYKELMGDFTELAASMKQAVKKYEDSRRTERCGEIFDAFKERIGDKAGEAVKLLLERKPGFIDRTKFRGQNKVGVGLLKADNRNKDKKLNDALKNCEFKKALNVIEDKAPVNVIDGHVIGLLKSKYPHDPTVTIPTAERSLYIPKMIDLRDVLRKKKASKHGHSGLTYGEIKAICKSEALANNVLDLVTLILNGWINGDGKQGIKTGRGIVLAKAWSGEERRSEVKDVRPINAVEAYLSLADGLIYEEMKEKCIELAGENQMGLKPRGNQQLAIMMQVWFDAMQAKDPLDEDTIDCLVMASLDLRNAFNALCRTLILEFIQEHFPTLVGYFGWLYGDGFDVVFGEEKIRSEMGVSQGSPSSALLFDAVLGIALSEVIKRFEDEGKLRIMLCHDGLFVMGRGSEVLKFKDLLEGQSERDPVRILPKGLAFNTTKCEVLCVVPGGCLAAGFNEGGWRIMEEGGMMVAGIPVGTNRFRDELTTLKTKALVERITKTMEATINSLYPLGFISITKLCLLPSMVYWATCVPVTRWPRQAIDPFSKLHTLLLCRLTRSAALSPDNSDLPISEFDVANAKLAAITRLKLWSPGIQGLSAFISNLGCLEHKLDFVNKALGISDMDAGLIEQTQLLKAYKQGKAGLHDFLVNNGVLSKDLDLDVMNRWGTEPPEPGLCSKISFFLAKAVGKRFPLGAYSSIFVQEKKTKNVSIVERKDLPRSPSKCMFDTAMEFLHSSNKSSVQYLNMSLAKNSRIDAPSGPEQRVMLLHTLGFNFGTLLTECELCKKEIGCVSRHADCCGGAGGERAMRHDRIKKMIYVLLQQAPGLTVDTEPCILDHFNLKDQRLEDDVRRKEERSDLVVRSMNGVLGFWDVCVGGVLVSDVTDEGTPGSRARIGNKAKVAKHSKYLDLEKKLHGFALDTCGGMDVEASKAIDLWSMEILGKHGADEDDRLFFGARIRQCISMKLIGGKASSIMDVLRLARRKHVYPQKVASMLPWPMLGLGALYDFLNARDGVVSDEPIEESLTGVLVRMAFNAQNQFRIGRFAEEIMGERGDGEEKEASRNDVEMEANEYKEQEGSEVGRRLWDVHGADRASPSSEESPPNRFGFYSDELMSQSDFSGRNEVGSCPEGVGAHGESNGGPISGMSSGGTGTEVSDSAIASSGSAGSEGNTQLNSSDVVSGSGGVASRTLRKSKKPYKANGAKPSKRKVPVADVRPYNTTRIGRGERMLYKEQIRMGVIQENVINSVNSGGSVQLESIVPAAQVPGAIDSSQESELVMTM